jgi:uncharacterized damage-inducible protein DinB
MTTERAEPALDAGEREMLTGWLDYHRSVLAWKCEGLTDAQLKERSVPPSGLSLLGLVRHMTENEQGWFRVQLLGEDLPDVYSTEQDRDGDFNLTDSVDVATVLRTWEQACDAARAAVDSVPDLNAMSKGRQGHQGEQFSLRWILSHMVEEYARHNGHADLLRERLDGTTGAG